MTYASGRSWLSIILLLGTFLFGVPAVYAAAGDAASFQDAAGDVWRVTADRTMIAVAAANVNGLLTADNATVNGTVSVPTVNATTVHTPTVNATQLNVTRVVEEMVVISTHTVIPTAHATYYANTNTSAINVTLPNANVLPEGDKIVIHDHGGSAGSATIAVNASNTTGAGNINGAANVNITTNYGAKTYKVRAGKWYAY